jgi:hypothetical protein
MTSKLHQTARSFVQSFRFLEVAEMLAIRTDDTIQEFAPSTMGMPPLRGKAEIRSFFTSLSSVVKTVTSEIYEILCDEENNKALIWCENTFELESEAGPGHSETVLMIETDETHEKVIKAVEFMDVALALDMSRRIRSVSSLKQSKS